MSAVNEILLAPDVRPFAIAAAIMVALGGIELVSMLVGLSIGELVGHDLGVDADSHNALGGLFLWINAGRLPLLILIVLVLGVFSIEGFLLQGFAHAIGAAVPVSIAALAAGAGSIPVIRAASRGIARIIPRDETYAVLDAVDTKYVKFGPDIGQLTKGGSDAVQVVKDYLPLVQHMHLKDYNGVDPHLLGYCPLGQGKVNIPAILDLMAGRKIHGMVMVELDNDPKNPSPTTPVELVKISKIYLESLGLTFRA